MAHIQTYNFQESRSLLADPQVWNSVILGIILGLYWDNGKENGNYYWGSRV